MYRGFQTPETTKVKDWTSSLFTNGTPNKWFAKMTPRSLGSFDMQMRVSTPSFAPSKGPVLENTGKLPPGEGRFARSLPSCNFFQARLLRRERLVEQSFQKPYRLTELSSSEKDFWAPFICTHQECDWASEFHFVHIARTQESTSETLMPDECISKYICSQNILWVFNSR